MNNFIKVLLLHTLDDNIEIIKESIFSEHRKCLFIVAKSKTSFFEKLKWMNPDVVVSDIKIDDYSGEEAFKILKNNRPNTPFIFALEKPQECDYLVAKVIEKAEGNLTFDNLTELPKMIKELIFSKSKQTKIDKLKDDSIYQNKKMLNKALTYLEDGNDLAKINVITDCLKSV